MARIGRRTEAIRRPRYERRGWGKGGGGVCVRVFMRHNCPYAFLAQDGVDGGTLSGSPSNPFEAAKDAFANPFNFGSSASDDPFAAVADSDPFDFDVAEADPLSFSGVKGVNLSVLEPRETFAVDTKNPFGGTSADDFGGGGKFSFGAPGKGDDPFA